MTDVGEAEGPEDGVGDGMGEDIGIGVTGEAVGMGDGDAAEDEGAVFCELVDVVADAGAGHEEWGSWNAECGIGGIGGCRSGDRR